ncbi:MAG: PHB depolymerase family esterase [Pseudomonadota bacterium]
MTLLLLKIIAGVVGFLVVIAILAVIAFRAAVAKFNRPPLEACGVHPKTSCDGVFKSADCDLSYRLLYPDSQTPPAALFVMLHGAGLSGPTQDWLSDGQLQDLATRENIIVLLPSAKTGGPSNSWLDYEHPNHEMVKEMTDQAPLLFALIDKITTEHNISRSNVAIAGYSNGGTMAMRLACEAPLPFCAVGAFGSPTTHYQIDRGCDHPTPAMIVHGTADSANPFHGGYASFYGIKVRQKGLEPALSSQQTVDFWRKANGCTTTAKVENLKSASKDGTSTQIHTYESSVSDRTSVIHVVIKNGGHYIPGDRPFPLILQLMQGGKRPTGFSGYTLFWDYAKGRLQH